MLAHIVGVVAIISINAQEVKTGTDTAIPGPEPPGPIPRALTTLRSPPRCGWNGFASGRFLTSAA